MKSIIRIFASKKSEAYVDSAMKIMISVVIGALLLALLCYLFTATVVTERDEVIAKLFSDASNVANGATSSQIYKP